MVDLAPTAALHVETPEKFGPLFHPPIRSGVRYRVFYGGRGSAKSWQFARALLVHGLTTSIRVLCVREYQTSMRQSVHRILKDQIKRLGLSHVYKVSKTEIVSRINGTEFIFAGLRRDIEQVKSTEGVDVCWVEEAQSVSDASWEVLIPTIRAAGSEIWVSFNPGEATDPTYRRFVLSPAAPDMIRVKVTWRDNPYLTDVLRRERDHLLEVDPEAEAHVWEGEPWSRSEAQVLKGKWIVRDFDPFCKRRRKHWDDQVVAEVPAAQRTDAECYDDPKREGERCPHCASWGEPLYGADWGFSQDPSIAVKLWRKDSRLWIEYEAGGIQLDNDATAEAFLEIPGLAGATIPSDSARPETINEMRKRDLRCVGAEKWDGSVKDGIAHLRSYAEIVIHPRCTMTIESARLWRFKTDPRTGAVLSRLRERHDDPFDATRYALAKIIRSRANAGDVWFPGIDGDRDDDSASDAPNRDDGPLIVG